MKKRVLAAVLAVALVLAALPMAAAAETTYTFTSSNTVDELAAWVQEENANITLETDVTLSSMLNISGNGVVLNLNNHIITGASTFPNGTDDSSKHVINISGNNVTIQNGTIVATAANRHVVNVWKGAYTSNTTVELSNLILNHSAAATGAPLVICRADVVLSGTIDFVLGTHSWYAVNVDPRMEGGSIDFAPNTKITSTGNEDVPLIKVDKPVTGQETEAIKNADNAGLSLTTTADGSIITANPKPATVTFRVVNGRWSNGTAGDQVVSVELSNSGRGTLAANQIPTPVANYGYSGGGWSPAPTAGMTITGDVTFTYTFYETQYAPPTILVQPQPAVVTEGGIATFSVTAVSSNPYNPNDFVATWMVSRDGITWSRVGTGTTLQLPVTAEDDGLQVRCTLQTGNGRRDTTPVTLTVLPGAAIVPGDEEIVEPGGEEGDLAEGTEETPPEETEELPEEGLEELPEEGEDLPEEPVDVPQTGDAAPSIGLAILLGLAVCAIAWKKVRAK